MDLIDEKDAYTDFQDECAHFPKDIWHLTRDLVTKGMSRSEAVEQGERWLAERKLVLAQAKSFNLFFPSR